MPISASPTKQHLRHLAGRALVQLKLHLAMRGQKIMHRRGQGVARLGVGGGDAEGAGVTAQKILAGAVQVIGIQQQALHPGHNPLARRRQTREALASADE